MPITTEMIAFFLTVVAAIGGVWYKIESKFDARMKSISDEHDRLRAEFADYKVFVATNHVSASTLRDTEERLITAIDKLGNRLEAIVARLDKMTR